MPRDDGLSRLRLVGVLRLAIVLLWVAAVVAAAWRAYGYYGGLLVEQLEENLMVLGRTGALLLDGRPAAQARDMLGKLQQAAGLENAFVCDGGGRSLADARGNIPPGRRYSPLLLDDEALGRALAGGQAVFGQPAPVAGFMFRSVYAPVRLAEGRGVLVLSAGEGFAGALSRLRRAARWAVAAVLAAAALYLGLFGASEYYSRRLARRERRRNALVLVGFLAAEIAHRIRNPLAIILSTAERLKRRYGKDAADPVFDYIPEEVRRVNQAVDRLLSLGQEEPARRGPLRASELLQRAQEAAGVEKRFPAVTVRREVPRDGLLTGDGEALAEALANLLVNAAESMRGPGEVTLRAAEEQGRVVITVTDTGPGIPGERLPHIFEPFVSFKEKGTGLGLAVAARIFEQHGATVAVRSGKQGTTFTIRFPAPRAPRESQGKDTA